MSGSLVTSKRISRRVVVVKQGGIFVVIWTKIAESSGIIVIFSFVLW